MTAADPAEEDAAHERWRHLMHQLSAEISAPLTLALERIDTLAATGRIDRRNLRALREEVAAAREAGKLGQQLARLATGRLRQSRERLDLTAILESTITAQARRIDASGVAIRPRLEPVEVIGDAALLSGLLDTLIDWALTHAQSNIEIQLGLKPWPVQARLTCRFASRLADQIGTADEPSDVPTGLDTLAWRLIEQSAWTMGLTIQRTDAGPHSILAIEFPRTVNNDLVEGLSTIELDQGSSPAKPSSNPLAGHHVLIVGARREVRQQVREAIRDMGLIIDFVGSVDEATAFCNDGLPHAIVYEAALAGERLDALIELVRGQASEFVFIEIIEEGELFEVSSFSGNGIARVSRDAIAASLASALTLELSRSL